MFRAIPRYTQISGSAVYPAPDGQPTEAPAAVDCDVTLPTIGHPTTDVSMCGTYAVADQTRVDNLELQINCGTNREALELLKYESFIIRFVQQVEDPESGTTDYKQFTVYASGHVSSSGGSSLAIGGAPDGNVTVNCLRYRLLQGDEELINIDRLAGKIMINGVDKRARINSLL